MSAIYKGETIGWKNVYFLGSKPNFSQFEFSFYVQKGKISPQIPKFLSTLQYFSGMSFPNSPFFLTMGETAFDLLHIRPQNKYTTLWNMNLPTVV